ncbi:MAG: hypothetical protein WBP13_04025 [Methylophilaceae bacterium]
MKTKISTSKPIIYLFLFSFLLLLIWYGRGYFYDEMPDEGREAFYAGADRIIPDETNVAVVISGLSAPVDIDTIKHGLTMIDASDILGSSINKIDDAKIGIKFIGLDKKDEINCALKDAIEYDVEHCTSAPHINKMLEQNKILLNRYFGLYKIMDWQGTNCCNGQIFINLNRLLNT